MKHLYTNKKRRYNRLAAAWDQNSQRFCKEFTSVISLFGFAIDENWLHVYGARWAVAAVGLNVGVKNCLCAKSLRA